ncbi:MAG: M48 family metalloprotease [Alphaproteobacteria bacterium]|nr:M48 family metalloprotease [Alphaproteobacteria bacterium]
MSNAFMRMARSALVGLTLAAAFFASPAARAQGSIRDAEIETVIRGYWDPILRAANIDPAETELVIINDNSINAFVTNSRSMFIHTGLIMAAQNPSEIKGVIAHETGHMAGAHVSQSRAAMGRAMRPALLSIGLGILAIAAGAPDAGAALIAGSQQFAYADFVQFTQAQESKADQAAVTLMEASGQSGQGLLDFASRQFRYNEMRSASRIPPWMRTHPLWSDRIQALRQRVEAGTHRGVVDSPADMEQLRLMQGKLFGYVERPSRTFQKYPDTDTSAAARYARSIAAMQASDFGRADKEAESLTRDFPTNPYYHELVGEILLNSGRVTESVPHHRRALELKPRNALLQVNLARALAAVKTDASTDEAITLLNAATQIEPDNATAWYELSLAYDRKGDEGMARLASAELRFAVGDFPGARSFAERAKERLARETPSWRRAADIATIAETRVRQGRG